MTVSFDVNPNDLIEKAAEELKKDKNFAQPKWADFAKTGAHKERPPVSREWWYFRVAAVLRSILKLGPIGVSKLRTKYGGRKNRGHKPEKFYKGSGSVIRKALQQLEKAGYVQQIDRSGHKGRVITPSGKSFLDKIAIQLIKQKPKPEVKEEKKPEVKAEVKKQPKPEVKEEKKPEVKEKPAEK